MREIGMSTRAIASATGNSDRTIRRASEGGQLDPPTEQSPVTGTDGKTYSPRPRHDPEPHERPRAECWP